MRIGAVFPHHDFDNSPDAIARFALGIEELGFDHLLAYDHVLGAEHADRVPPLNGPYDESHGFREVLVLFGYLAAIT
ncbi:MAG: LLM class F420-dependent oxidoreductase, partial [Ilumatobacteraceae bacterium]